MPSQGTKTHKGVRQKHIPTRMCVICRDTNAKRTLTRIVRTGESSYEVDPTGRANGRGAYICDKKSCWDKATGSQILAKALRVSPDEDSNARLKEFAAGLTLDDGANAATAGSKE